MVYKQEDYTLLATPNLLEYDDVYDALIGSCQHHRSAFEALWFFVETSNDNGFSISIYCP